MFVLAENAANCFFMLSDHVVKRHLIILPPPPHFKRVFFTKASRQTVKPGERNLF